MPEKFERVGRPSPSVESEPVAAPRGVNRNHLTLYFSIAAMVLSVASNGVNLYVFRDIGQQKMRNESLLAAAQANLAKQNEILIKIQQVKEQQLARLEPALKEQQIKTAAAQQFEAEKNAALHKQEARSAAVKGNINESIPLDQVQKALQYRLGDGLQRRSNKPSEDAPKYVIQ